MKGTKKTFALFLFMAVLFGIAIANATLTVTLTGPINNTANSSTNDTTTFTFTSESNETETAICRLIINGTNSSAETEVANGTETAIQSNRSLVNSKYTWTVRCRNATDGTGKNAESVNWTLFLDNTAPTVSTIVTTSPIDNYNTSSDTVNISCMMPSKVDNLFDNINLSLVLNGTINQTTTGVKSYATYNFTVPFHTALKSGEWHWQCRLSDNATNTVNTANRTLFVDRTKPTIVTAMNSGVNMSYGIDWVLQYNFSFRDMLPIDKCWVRVYDANGNYTDIQGSKNASNSNNIKCNAYVVNLSPYMLYGRITSEFWVNDSVGNANTTGTNQTNTTLVKLYPKWNLIQLDRNSTLELIANLSSNITQVSRFNNTAKVFTTYVKGVAANGPATVMDGDGVYVYANQTLYLAFNWTRDGGFLSINMSGLNQVKGGWNVMSHLNQTGRQMYQICANSLEVGIWNCSTINITSIAYYASNESRFVTHRCDFKYNNESIVPYGYAFWFHLNGTDTASYRTVRSP